MTYSLDRDVAIDIAVQKGLNSFAEHLNNLLFEFDGERIGSDEEKNDRSVSIVSSGYNRQPIQHHESEVDDSDTYDLENSLADSNDVSVSARTAKSSTRTMSNDFENYVHENLDGVCNDFSTIDLDVNSGGVMKSGQSERRELFQAKYALKELMNENEVLKSKLAVYCEDTDIESSLAKKSLTELNSIEEQVRRSLDRIIKAKEVASNNLEDARMCVICKESPKSVLFLNCRHLCVCIECGHLDILVQCPLCRMEIREKINVYA